MGLRQELDRELEWFPPSELWAEIESRATRPGPVELPASHGGPGGLPRKRLVAAVVALVVFLGAFAILWSEFRAAPPRPAEPTPSPIDLGPGPRRNGELIQFEDIAGTSAVDLVAQDPATGQLRLFADTSAVIDCSYVGGERCHILIGRAAWSADGRWVAFEVFCSVGTLGDGCGSSLSKQGLWVVGVGVEPRQVAGPCASCDPKDSELVWAWGPAGAGVAYADRYAGEGELFVFDPSDGTRMSLGRVDSQITALTWSPDGSRIALAGGGALYLVDPGSGNRSRIATYQGVAEDMYSSGWPAGIEWSPDGTKIALVTHSPGRIWEWGVQVLDAEGSQLFDLPVPGGGPLGDPPQVAWSPDGTQIAYTTSVRYPGGGDGGQVWTVASDGSNPTMVFDPGFALGLSLRPTWSPDGTRLGFTVGRPDGRPAQWLVVDMDDIGNIGEPHPIDERTLKSWRGGSFSAEAWEPGHLG